MDLCILTGHRQHHRSRVFCRRLLIDILPTLLLLLAMALGMALVARYAESSHDKPMINDKFPLKQISE